VKKGVSVPVATKMYNPLANAFVVVERDSGGLNIMQFTAANIIPFDMMRSTQYYEILPPFRNIRCFRFVKQMYLDTF
jgi:hypothetical protein